MGYDKKCTHVTPSLRRSANPPMILWRLVSSNDNDSCVCSGPLFIGTGPAVESKKKVLSITQFRQKAGTKSADHRARKKRSGIHGDIARLPDDVVCGGIGNLRTPPYA